MCFWAEVLIVPPQEVGSMGILKYLSAAGTGPRGGRNAVIGTGKWLSYKEELTQGGSTTP